MAKKKSSTKAKTVAAPVVNEAPAPPPDPWAGLSFWDLENMRRKTMLELIDANKIVSRENLKGDDRAALMGPLEEKHKALQEAIKKRQEG